MELGEVLVFPLGDIGLGLFDLAVDACEPGPDGGILGDFLEVVGVLVQDGVRAVHEGRNLDELLDPFVDESEDGVVFEVGASEFEVETQLEVLDVDVDEEEWRLGLLLARRFGLELLVHDLEVVQDRVSDAVCDALVDEVDVFLPLARLAVGADLLHGAELVVVDLLQFLFDFLLLDLVLSVDRLL